MENDPASTNGAGLGYSGFWLNYWQNSCWNKWYIKEIFVYFQKYYWNICSLVIICIVWRIQKKYFYTVEVCRIIACGERWEKYLNIPKKHHICSTNKQTDRHFVCPWFIHAVSFLLLRLFTVVFIALLIWTEQQRPGKNKHHCFYLKT